MKVERLNKLFTPIELNIILESPEEVKGLLALCRWSNESASFLATEVVDLTEIENRKFIDLLDKIEVELTK